MAKQPFTPHLDVHLGRFVDSEQKAKEIAKEMGLTDSREFGDVENVAKTATRNREEEKKKTYGGYDDAVARALYREEHGYEFEKTLEADIRKADEKNAKERKG